jgi:hypothetical protein
MLNDHLTVTAVVFAGFNTAQSPVRPVYSPVKFTL